MESLQTKISEELNEDVLSAQEKLNIRREARRKNILENAKNRLEKLNGRTFGNNTGTTDLNEHQSHFHANGPNYLDSVEFSDPEVEPDLISQQLTQDEPPIDFGDLINSLNIENTPPQQKRHIILRARLHLIISALVSCILSFLILESTTYSFSIFIPAGLCVIIDLLFFREQQPLNPIINLVITMCNIRLPSQTKNILHIFSIIQSLIVDIGVFIFCYCIFTCSFVYMNNRFIDLIVIK